MLTPREGTNLRVLLVGIFVTTINQALELAGNSPEAQVEALKHVDDQGNETWSAREAMRPLGFTNWRNFEGAIKTAQGVANLDVFAGQAHIDASINMVSTGNGAHRQVSDYQLNRLGMYLLLQGADGTKPEIAAWKIIFAASYELIRTGRVVSLTAGHVRDSVDFWKTQGPLYVDGRMRHSAGRTYAVMTGIDTFKVGFTSGWDKQDKNPIKTTVGRLRDKGTGPLLRVIQGGWTRERELMAKLADFAIDDGNVDNFRALPASLDIVESFSWSRDGRQIQDLYNRSLINSRLAITSR